MAKSEKKRRGKKSERSKGDSHAQLRTILAEANARKDPLSTLPSAFLSVSISPPHRGVAADNENNAGDKTSASADNYAPYIEHFSSPLPTDILRQCLELFQMNMGDMYRRSSWGLDLEEKSKELQHADARFLVVLSSGSSREATTAESNDDEADTKAENSHRDSIDREKCVVLGFAHYRHERDDDVRPSVPVTYLYELQIHPDVQKLGLGKRLSSIVEILSLNSKMKKVMLTVFHSNEAAMGFYRKRKYTVDECSPSIYYGGENKNCDYEILSKSLG